MQYEYSSIDRIANPHSYMYTSYGGDSFIELYKDSRKTIINKLVSDTGHIEISACINGYLYSSPQSGISEIVKLPIIDSVELFKGIAVDILNGQNAYTDSYSILSVFIKKYEVFKKLYRKYNKSFKKQDNNSRDLEVYVLFSFCLMQYHIKYKNLKMLNCLLKVNDALCSVIEEFNQVENKVLLSLTLKSELSIIEELIQKRCATK